MRWHGYIGRFFRRSNRPSNRMSLWVAPANSSRGLSTCPMRSLTCAARTVRPPPMCASAGIDRCSTSRTPSRSARSRYELAALAGRDPLEYLRKLIGPQRKIDLKAQGVDYPNYGSPIELYPIDTGRLRATLDPAAENAGWGQPLPSRHGRGIAVHRSSFPMSRQWSRSPSLMTDRFRFHASMWPSIAASP